MNEQFNSIVSDCAAAGQKTAQAQANKGNTEPLYLYFLPSTANQAGQLLLVPDSQTPPEGFQLATGEGLRCNVEFSRFYTWVRERSTRLPILAWN